MHTWRRNEGGEPGEELRRGKRQVVAAVGERTLEAVNDSAVGKRTEAGERQRRAGAVAAEKLEPGAMTLADVDVGMQRFPSSTRNSSRNGSSSRSLSFSGQRMPNFM